jgi:hypothetical protein
VVGELLRQGALHPDTAVVGLATEVMSSSSSAGAGTAIIEID